MPKNSQTITKQQKSFRFFDKPEGHLVLLAIIWFIGYNLTVLAIDTGSLLQWGGVLISLFWGLYHLIEALKMYFKKIWKQDKKN